MSSLCFVLWQSAGTTPSQHLALYDPNPDSDTQEPVLAHWRLPRQRHQRLAQQSHSLLVETADFPPVARVLDSGVCVLLRGELPVQAGLERLHLLFEGRSLRGCFALLRLQPGSTRWLFGPRQYMPDKFVRGSVTAPLWPTTQHMPV